jgi:hypothetical protein
VAELMRADTDSDDGDNKSLKYWILLNQNVTFMYAVAVKASNLTELKKNMLNLITCNISNY